MWTDWHADVRSAAAQALASTGHGPAVHDSVLDRMSHPSPIIRRDAVRRLGQLGVLIDRRQTDRQTYLLMLITLLCTLWHRYINKIGNIPFKLSQRIRALRGVLCLTFVMHCQT